MDDELREMYEKKLEIAYAKIEELGGVVPTGFILKKGMLKVGAPKDISEALLGYDAISIMSYLNSLGVEMLFKVKDGNLCVKMKLNGTTYKFEGLGIDLWKS